MNDAAVKMVWCECPLCHGGGWLPPHLQKAPLTHHERCGWPRCNNGLILVNAELI